MRLPGYFIALLVICAIAACATKPPRFRAEAITALERAKKLGADGMFPAEFAGSLAAFAKGETLLKAEGREDAERYYHLTLLKGALLEQEVREEKARLEEAARRAEELKKAELERLAREEADRLARAEAAELARKEAIQVERAKPKPQKEEVVQVLSYTVKRGESLPLIASHPEVYGDRNLWPLIYRANRDQIRDPRHIWPGQVLRVRRNYGRDDVAEARRYSQERPLH